MEYIIQIKIDQQVNNNKINQEKQVQLHTPNKTKMHAKSTLIYYINKILY